MNTVLAQPAQNEPPAVRFPLAGEADLTARRGLGRLAQLVWLLPHRWRRRVVIGGVRFWIPPKK